MVFSLPGAFTPTCTNRQCPAYDLMYDQFRTHGIDEVYCISVNDAFVMHQWARSLGLQNVKLIPDGNGQFTRRMGMLINKEHLGFGYRSWRYAMVVDDGVIENWFEDPASTTPAPTTIPMARPIRNRSCAVSTPHPRSGAPRHKPAGGMNCP